MILNILNWYQTVGKDLSIKDKTKEDAKAEMKNTPERVCFSFPEHCLRTVRFRIQRSDVFFHTGMKTNELRPAFLWVQAN